MTTAEGSGNDSAEPLVGRGGAEGRDGLASHATRPVPRPSIEPSSLRDWARSLVTAPRLRLALGIAIVVGLAGAWALVGRKGARPTTSPGPERSTVTRAATATSTAVTEQAAVAVPVPRWVPTAIAATCRARDAVASGVVVDCTPGRGVDHLRYRVFPSVAALRAAYAAGAPVRGGAGPSRCARGAPEERSWSAAAAPDAPAGRYRCSFAGDRARLVWTSERSGSRRVAVLAVASRADRDLRSLYQWWTTVPGPTAS